jgi:hypothetical protein
VKTSPTLLASSGARVSNQDAAGSLPRLDGVHVPIEATWGCRCWKFAGIVIESGSGMQAIRP